MPSTKGVVCPRCGEWTRKSTEAEALAECPQRDYAAEGKEARMGAGRKVHDFPVIWVGVMALPEPVRMPWPADAVRHAPPPIPDDFTELNRRFGGDA